MISALLPPVAIVGVALSWSRLWNKPIELGLAPACSLIILVISVGGAFGHLAETTFAVCTVGVGLAALLIWTNPAQSVRRITTPGSIVFLACVISAPLLFGKLHHWAWDEFSHWGLASKFILLSDRLPERAGEVHFQDYPVASSLFHYFMVKAGGFSEGRVIAANVVLQAAAIMPLFALLSWRQPALTIVAFLVGAGAVYIFLPFAAWDTVLVDSLLGMMTAAPILIYLAGGRDPRSLLMAAPILAVLPLLKDMGLLFALLVWAIIVFDQVVTRGRVTTSLLLAGAASILLVVLSRGLWSLHLQSIGASANYMFNLQGRFSRPEFLAGSYDLPRLTQEVGKLWLSRMTVFYDGWASQRLYPPAIAVIMIAATGFISAIFSKTERRSIVIIHSAFAIFTLLYCIMLAFLYILIFPLPEALALASFYRYVNGILFPWIIVTGALLINADMRFKPAFLTLFVGITLACSAPHLISLGQQLANPAQAPIRAEVAENATMWLDSVPVDSAVYSIWNGTNGYEHFIFSYDVKPRPTNFWYYSLGEQRFNNDLWSEPLTVEELRQRMQPYEYAFIGKSDDMFWSTYGRLFDRGQTEERVGWFWRDPSSGIFVFRGAK